MSKDCCGNDKCGECWGNEFRGMLKTLRHTIEVGGRGAADPIKFTIGRTVGAVSEEEFSGELGFTLLIYPADESKSFEVPVCISTSSSEQVYSILRDAIEKLDSIFKKDVIGPTMGEA